MKRILPILLSLCLLLTLVSCAGKTPPAADGTTAATEPAVTDDTAIENDATTADETEAGSDANTAPANTEETAAQETEPEETAAVEIDDVAAEPAMITLTWAEVFDRDLDALTTCNAVDDPQTAFVITTDRAVSGLQILSLYEASFGDDGAYTFSHDAVYSQDTLSPDAPLVVNTTFYGDTPNIGIRYIDTDGSEKTYAIDVSGMDGSLYLLALEGGSAQ
jgi:hypothetical protein